MPGDGEAWDAVKADGFSSLLANFVFLLKCGGTGALPVHWRRCG